MKNVASQPSHSIMAERLYFIRPIALIMAERLYFIRPIALIMAERLYFIRPIALSPANCPANATSRTQVRAETQARNDML
jgi:hypothetical protein